MNEQRTSEQRTWVERAFRPFGEVRAGEAITLLLMLANIFTILAGYNVLKTVRDALILNIEDIEGFGGAEIKTFSAAAQVVLLLGFIPLYGWFASRVDRMRLILGFNLFFILCIEAFFLAGQAAVPYVEIAFFIWVGIFNYSVVAQFWSYGNDIYSRAEGERLFPIIVIGMTSGAALGPKAAAFLFDAGFSAFSMMQLGVGALAISLVLYRLVERREDRRETAAAAESGAKLGERGAFSLIKGSRYLILIALTLVLANWVNTNGGYILDRLVESQADLLPEDERERFVGAFLGNFYFGVNVASALIQMLLVSRIVKYLGIAGVIFALPIVAFGAYGVIGLGASFALTRWVKTAENSTDYSVMNTAKQMLWLPTTREEKYKAKQATDTIFVRIGDLLTAGTVLIGTTVLVLGVTGFAGLNLVIVLVWLWVGWLLYRENRAQVAQRGAKH